MPSPHDTSPIRRALDAGSMDLLRHAVELGESVSRFEQTGQSVIIEMVRVCSERQLDQPSVSELLRMGADPNKVGPHGMSPLCFVMMRMAGERSCMAESVVALLCAGARVDYVMDNEMSDMTWRPRHRECKSYPLALAIQVGSISAAEAILLAGGSPNGLNELNSLNPLSIAAKWREDAFAHLLLRKCADLNLKNGDGTVAMHHCWEHVSAQLLLGSGAKLDIPDNLGRHPLHEWVEQVTDPQSLIWLAGMSPKCRFARDGEGHSPLDTLRERFASDPNVSLWAGEIIAHWEADLMAQQMKGTTEEGQADASSRRL